MVNQKKYIIKKIQELIEIEKNIQIKQDTNKKLKEINKHHFRIKNLLESNKIGTLYNIIKFDEFLEDSKIDNEEKLKKLKRDINEYSKNKDNFKEFLDKAFMSAGLLAILNPIIEYAQAIYIPNTATEFHMEYVTFYLLTVAGPIILVIIINHYIHKLNDYKNRLDKNLLLKLNNKLSYHDFNYNKLDTYLQIKIEDK